MAHFHITEFPRKALYTTVLMFLLGGSMFILDLALPLGVAAGFLYVLVVIIGGLSQRESVILTGAGLSTVLTLLGWGLSPEGGMAWVVTANRIFALGTIWITTFLLVLHQRANESINFQEGLFDHLGEGVSYVRKHDNEIVFVNTGFEKMFGYEPNELIGQNVQVLNASSDFDPVEQAQIILQALDTDGQWRGELKNRRKDGSEFWSEGQVSGFEKSPYGPIWISIHNDISTRVHALEELKWKETIVNTMFAGTALARLSDRTLVYVNPRFEQMFGYGPGELLGKDSAILNGGSEEDAARKSVEVIDSIVKTGAWSGEILNRRKDGTEFWCVSSVTVFDHPEFGQVGLGVQEDISQIKQAEEEIKTLNTELERRIEERTTQLRDAQEELVRKEKLATLGQLAATVNHELRNPLSSIRTTMFSLSRKMKKQNFGSEKLVDRIDRNIERCANIVNEMRAYARSNKVELETIEYDSWVETSLLDIVIPEGITLETKLLAGEVRVALDKEKFYRVFVNIIENACQAILDENGAKDGRLKLSTKADSGVVTTYFEDNGPGINPESLETIFEPLTSTKIYGVGLGLAIVKQIVELHQGNIQIKNQSNAQGTMVAVELPIQLSA